MLCSAAVHAKGLPESIKRQLHGRDELRLVTLKGKTPSLERLAGAKIVVWQVLPEDTSPEHVKALLAWVDKGGTLWFQDSRLAEGFGMQAAPAGKADLRNVKDHKGHYGSIQKFPGVATIATAPPLHRPDVLKGVDAVQVFLMRVGEDQYSVLRQTADLVPLLKIQQMSTQPLYDRIIAGMMRRGQGIIVFKPLIFDEQLTGARFQANLLEFSAGFPVPEGEP